MVSIQFKLKDSESSDPTSIRCIFYHHGNRFMYSLGDDKTILPHLWDKTTMYPIVGKSKEEKDLVKSYKQSNPNIEIELQNIGVRIENVKREITSFISNQEIKNRQWNFDELKNHLRLIFDKKEIVEIQPVTIPITLNQYIEYFLEGLYNGKITYTTGSGEMKQYTSSSVKVYKEFKTQFELYQGTKKVELNFNDITLDFYSEYVQYYAAKNYANNSIGKQIKCLKAILSKAFDEGIHRNDVFKKTAFKTLKSDIDSIYLTENELKDIYDLDLSSKPHLDVARDIFLCGCYTALRYSDYSRLRKEHFVYKDSNLYIDMITQKTKQRVVIPVKPLVKTILEKYDYLLPKSYEQKLNRYIKEIGLLVGINEKVEVKTIRGSKTIINYVPKNQLIMTHTARRTGATLLYKANVDSLSIMKITGHKTEKSFLKYIKVSDEENAIKLTSNPFFK